jgi:hypothetical protein
VEPVAVNYAAQIHRESINCNFSVDIYYANSLRAPIWNFSKKIFYGGDLNKKSSHQKFLSKLEFFMTAFYPEGYVLQGIFCGAGGS